MHNFGSVHRLVTSAQECVAVVCLTQIVEGRMRRILIALAISLVPSFAFAAHSAGGIWAAGVAATWVATWEAGVAAAWVGGVDILVPR